MCMLCTLDPTGAVLVLPFAQATVIAAPVLLRNQIKRGAKEVRRRMTTDGGDDPGSGAPEPATDQDVGKASARSGDVST